MSYCGGPLYRRSGWRLKREVRRLEIFDTVHIYRRKHLPIHIATSATYSCSRGDGYWMWKPYVILETLNKVDSGDIVVYSDCGNQISPGVMWDDYWATLEHYDSIFHKYREGEIYYWGNSNIKRWTKNSVIDYFSQGNDGSWANQTQFWAGFIVVKKTEETLKLIRSWLHILMFRPDLLIDTFGAEDNCQSTEFVEHRHDQAILTGILLTQQYANPYFQLESTGQSKLHKGTIVKKLRIQDVKLKDEMRRFMKQFVRRFLKTQK